MVEFLESELIRHPRLYSEKNSFLSSNTDPYQYQEKKSRITAEILQVFAGLRLPVSVSILTKSSLVLRDLELLRQIPTISVGLTLTTLERQMARALEPLAHDPLARLRTLEKLSSAGIITYAFLGPLLLYYLQRRI